MDERQQHRPGDGGAGDVEPLKLGRAASARRAWDDAYRRLSRADAAASLAVEDLERLAMSAYLTLRDDDYLRALGRAHRAWLEAGDGVRAARAALSRRTMVGRGCAFGNDEEGRGHVASMSHGIAVHPWEPLENLGFLSQHGAT